MRMVLDQDKLNPQPTGVVSRWLEISLARRSSSFEKNQDPAAKIGGVGGRCTLKAWLLGIVRSFAWRHHSNADRVPPRRAKPAARFCGEEKAPSIGGAR